jgi:hypothetical protein
MLRRASIGAISAGFGPPVRRRYNQQFNASGQRK